MFNTEKIIEALKMKVNDYGLIQISSLLRDTIIEALGEQQKQITDLQETNSNLLAQIEEKDERIAIMSEPVKRVFYPKTLLWECQGCGECVSGITKYCGYCGREFLPDEDENE